MSKEVPLGEYLERYLGGGLLPRAKREAEKPPACEPPRPRVVARLPDTVGWRSLLGSSDFFVD